MVSLTGQWFINDNTLSRSYLNFVAKISPTTKHRWELAISKDGVEWEYTIFSTLQNVFEYLEEKENYFNYNYFK